jgi:hypothetical protein
MGAIGRPGGTHPRALSMLESATFLTIIEVDTMMTAAKDLKCMRPAPSRFAAARCFDGDGVLRLETVADAGAAEEVRGHGSGHEPVLSNSLTGGSPAVGSPLDSPDLVSEFEEGQCLPSGPCRFAEER